MKIKTISRSADAFIPERNTDESRVQRNLNPELHPFERAREYKKALTATKMERMFAQPFVGQLGDGHRDAVYSIAPDFDLLGRVASGSGDGVVKYWNVKSRKEYASFKAHDGRVSGLVVRRGGDGIISCGYDKSIKIWSALGAGLSELKSKTKHRRYDDNSDSEFDSDESESEEEDEPVAPENGATSLKTFVADHALESIDHHYKKDVFATAGARILLWDTTRSTPILDMTWGAENVTLVRFNRVETNILASSGSDNSVVLYDLRTNSPIQKLVASLRTNCISFNPMLAYNFVCGSEDLNLYGYDMRNMARATNVYKDHVSAVLDVDFNPTGKQLVSASYDKTIRIYNVNEGHSKEVYHTKRMQQVYTAKYSLDSKFIFSGSDDCNVRVWRAVAWERTSVKSTRERNKLEYDEKLKEKFKYMPEIRRILRHRHVPIGIKKDSERRRVQLASVKRKEENVRRHGGGRGKGEREKHVVANTYK